MSEPTADHPQRPWYRHFWVWFLMVPPAATVVFWAVVLTTTAASPSLVVDDYAQIGLVYQQQREREAAAARLGIEARLHVTRGEGGITVSLAGIEPHPEQLMVRLTHPTEAGRDHQALVERSATGIYRGRTGSAVSGRRYVQIEPVDGAWRLTGEMPGHRSELVLAPPDHLAER